MKLQLLVVLAVVVLVPLSEGRKVSRCELKEKLGDAIVLHGRPLNNYHLAKVITEVEWRSDTRLYTSRVRVFGKRRPPKTTLPRKRRSLQKLEKKMMLSLTLPPTTTITLPTTTTTLPTTTTTLPTTTTTLATTTTTLPTTTTTLATTTTTLPITTTTLPTTTTTNQLHQPDPTPLAVTGTNRPNPTLPAITGTRPPTVVVETSPTIGSQTTQLQPRRAVIGTRAPTAGSDEEDGAPDEENGDSEVEENAGSDEEDAATDEENGDSEVEKNTGSDEEDAAIDEENGDSEVEKNTGSNEEDAATDEENGDSEVEKNTGSDQEDAAIDEENGDSEVEKNTGSDEEDDGAPDEQNDDSEVEEDGGVDEDEDEAGDDQEVYDDEDDVSEENTEESGSRKKRSFGSGHWSTGFYGVFQLSDALYCNSGYRPSRNICQTDCSAFTDDDISDDIACFVKSRAWVRYFKLSRLRPRPQWNLRDCH